MSLSAYGVEVFGFTAEELRDMLTDNNVNHLTPKLAKTGQYQICCFS